MHAAASPFPFPEKLDGNLGIVLNYWRRLRRADNSMPFWDDLNLSDLSALFEQREALLLIDAFDKPERFRFNNFAGEMLENAGRTFTGKFIDEVDLPSSLSYLRAQCSATVEARTPTYYRSALASPVYARVLLPMWGDGRIGMLLGAIAQY
jgi:hypothetical protein